MRIRNRFYRLLEGVNNDDNAGAGGAGSATGAGAGTGTGSASGGAAGAGTGTAGGNGAAGAGGAGGGTGSAGAGAGAATGNGSAGNGSASSTGTVNDWPDDWRTKIAGTDEKLSKQLARFGSPKDIFNSWSAAQARISSGELKAALPKDATAEQIQEWRTQNGIPASPDKYELKLADGLQIAEDDKELVDRILKDMHAVNANHDVASKAIQIYYNEIERAEAERATTDKAIVQATEDAMRAEWGPEYRPNINAIEGLMDMIPDGMKDLFKYGRLSDGSPIMGNAATVRWLHNMARDINPVTTLIPNSGANVMTAISAELDQINAWMNAPKGTPESDKYWKSEKTQERYRQLLDGQARAQAKGG